MDSELEGLLTENELERIKKRQERKVQKELKEKEIEEQEKKNLEIKKVYSNYIKNGFPVFIGDRFLEVYKIFDEDSSRLLGKAKNDQKVSFIGIDRKNKKIEKDIKEQMLFEICDESILEFLPLQKNGKIDIRESISKIPYCKIDFDIHKPFEFEEEAIKKFNVYVKPSYLEVIEPKSDIKNFKEFMTHLFPIEVERDYVYSYFKTSLIDRCRSKVLFLVGEQGIGKGFLYMLIKSLFPENVVDKISPKILNKNFIPNLKVKRLIYIDEVVLSDGGSARAQFRALTEDEVATEQKYQNEKTEKSNCSFMLSSNEISHLSFTSSERRPFVPVLSETPLEKKFSYDFLENLKKDFLNDDYKKAVFDYLMTFNDLPSEKIPTKYFEAICLNSAPQVCHTVLISCLKGEYKDLKKGVYYPIDSFLTQVGANKRSIKDATICNYLANFTWNQKHFFSYDKRKASTIKWLGVEGSAIKEYLKDLELEESFEEKEDDSIL